MILPRLPLLLCGLAAACGSDAAPLPVVEEPARAACRDRDPQRHVYFGDLHVHTSQSFDVYAFGVRNRPADAYRFARGEPLPLPAEGGPERTVRLARPLDFAAVTDHAEFLGEVEACIVPGSSAYDSPGCRSYRQGGSGAVRRIATPLALDEPERPSDICGAPGCPERGPVWSRTIEAAEQADDRSERCGFSTFIAYEYSAAPGLSNLHRNVIFRGSRVTEPVSAFEQPEPVGLWRALQGGCRDGGRGCDVLAIPHNSNLSNGRMFAIEYPDARTVEEQRALAAQRAALEPVVEVYQHKGDSECMNGLSGVLGAPDELCGFEKDWRRPLVDCGDGSGAGGLIDNGCFSRQDFVRGVLLSGLRERERIGQNPFPLGLIGSTDTHNGTPGAVEERGFPGHRGLEDDSALKRLGEGELTPGGLKSNPGGLAAIWAEENSRPSLFDALRRREVYGTSGPRISVRFFGGWDLPAELCADPAMVRSAYARGVPMGADLPPRPAGAGAPSFLVAALRDVGTAERPGTKLQRLQIIKGWIEQGQSRYQVFDVAGQRDGATVDLATCEERGPGADSLCGRWQDPSFQPGQQAFYYARVLENPSCRWSTLECNALPPAERPPGCNDPQAPRTIQERAWTSPIWYQAP